jgi:hypothetical protein
MQLSQKSTEITTTASIQGPQISKTPIFVPTFTKNEQLQWIDTMLNGIDRCSLPCLMGFTPGVTLWTNAAEVLTQIGFWVYHNNTEGFDVYEILNWPIDEYSVVVSPSFTVNSTGKITAIDIISFDGALETTTKEYWRNYTPEKILYQYGIPSEIYISIIPRGSSTQPNVASLSYSVYFVYEQQGFLIEYSGLTTWGNTINLCPSYDGIGSLGKGELRIRTVAIGAENLITEQQFLESGSIKTLFNATGVSSQEFYDYLISNSSIMCLKTPMSIWP